MMNWQRIGVLILDVDGVLTDGRVELSTDGQDRRIFYVQDGFAIKLWQKSGGKTAIISGRNSPVVQERARMLGINHVQQGIENKLTAYESLCNSLGVTHDEAACMGDDLPDLPMFQRCGFSVAPADATPDVKRWATYVTRRCGGRGAVAEAIELILRKQGRWRPGPLC